MAPLLLFTRSGCCLCEGLAEKLLALEPPPELRLVDIDADPALKARYDLEVPVLAVQDGDADGPPGLRELPRVSPRLAGDRLRSWLRKHNACG